MKQQLGSYLEGLAHDADAEVPDGFMEGVWERVGDISARRDRTMRSALFVALFAVGLSAGAVTVQVPAYAQDRSYPLFSDAGLSPSALLHVDR
ncbi:MULTISPECIES: hypothetical protein [unclassified Sphingosinithalassobacter]|uniref:hypothetical protein n=1 Tax=unclassified Sphingosinithalassobacter TaxID=2676235 RepID=UPI00165D3984|nr:hypothetical protein [Sphingosinithalassobacter sp. CS137]